MKDYERDLIARHCNPYNAEQPRVHLPPTLLAKPVQLLTPHELKKWRDSLLGKQLKPSTVNRVCRCLAAALELARQHDERVQNQRAWQVGLADLPNATEARNTILSDDEVRAFVGAAYQRDPQLGLLVDVLAICGARPSMVARLRVEDLHDHPVRPKLAMPRSGKGGGRLRAERKTERFSVPITVQLAARLREAARGRDGAALLLLQSDGTAWPASPSQELSSQHQRDCR